MDTGYPALIPEPLLSQKTLKRSTVPPLTYPDNPPDTATQADVTSAPQVEKIS